MSDFEKVAGKDEWISGQDHEVASRNIYDTTFQNGDARINFAAIANEQADINAQLYEKIITVGRHLIPLDTNDRISPDETRHAAYIVGATMAMATLDALCERLMIDTDMFRQVWQSDGTVRVLNLGDERIRLMSPREQYEALSTFIIETGHKTLAELDGIYDTITDSLMEVSDFAVREPAVAAASFGYVMSGGLNSIERILKELEAERLTEHLDYESMATVWATENNSERVEQSTLPIINHDEVAERIDTAVFFKPDETVESYIGEQIVSIIDSDDSVCDTINALAIVRYPNDSGNYSLDFTGEAFFQGGIVAMSILKLHAEKMNIGTGELYKAWKGTHTHGLLDDLGSLSDSQLAKAEDHIDKIILASTVPAPYNHLIEKFSHHMQHDEEEATALAHGFAYVYASGHQAIQSRRKAHIAIDANNIMKNFDDELRELLG